MSILSGYGLAKPSIDWQHDEIHKGHAFSLGDFDTDVDTGAGAGLYLIQTTEKSPHMEISLIASAALTFTLYEAPTISANGTALVPRNRNRTLIGYGETSYTKIYLTPTVSANGTLLSIGRIQAASTGPSQDGGGGTKRGEWILAPSTKYLLTVVPDADNIDVWTFFDWYE